jgi:biopolymer transport protein ExbB/TolQ
MPGACLNSWQAYGCEWTVGYLWRWMNWITRLDVYALALMLAYIVIIVSRGSYRHHIACHQTRTFMRDAANAFHSGAFGEVIAIAAKTPRSPVAAMLSSGLIALTSAPSQLTLREAVDTASRAFQSAQRTLVADLSFGGRTLKSIASTAPFLGLAGTCVGILSAFRGYAMERGTVLAMIATYIAASLLTTAAGLLVAIPAVWSQNYLRVRMDRLESEMSNMALDAITQLNRHPHGRSLDEHFVTESQPVDSGVDAVACFRIAKQFPLTKQFSKLPAFALIAAPSLAMVIGGFTTFASFRGSPTGLAVRVLAPGKLATTGDYSVKPIVIGLVETRNWQTAVFVNSQETPWENLDSTVRNELKTRPRPTVYVEAEKDVPWADVAKVIDAVEALSADVILLTVAPKFSSGHVRRSVKSMK